MQQRIYFRVDASADIGVGHVFRCLSLANYFSQIGYQCSFICKYHVSAPFSLIESAGYSLYKLPLEKEFEASDEYSEWLGSSEQWDAQSILNLNLPKANLLVVDHYGISAQWEAEVANLADKILVIDDLANRNHQCDYLVDTAIGRTLEEYEALVSENCECLIGPNFSILKQEFTYLRKHAEQKRIKQNKIEHVLVAMGGTDPKKLTLMALMAIEQLESYPKVTVILSSSCTWLDELKAHISSRQLNWVTLKIDIQDMPQEILNADFAIGAFGVGAIERCYLGLTSLNCVVAENQTYQSQAMIEASLCLACQPDDLESSITSIFGRFKSDLISNLDALSHAGLSTFKENGIENISQVIHANQLHALTYVDVNQQHKNLLYYWQTMPDTRKYFHNTQVPSYDDHTQWFDGLLKNQDRRMWILVYDWQPAGYIRLDTLSDHSEEVSIFVASQFRGNKIAFKALNWAKLHTKNANLKAQVHSDNQASKALFLSCGFVQEDSSINYEWRPEYEV